MAEPIGSLSDFAAGVPRRVELASGDAVLVYNAAGEVQVDTDGSELQHNLRVIGDVCPHKRARLSDGDIEDLGESGGICVRCPKHRRKFNGGGLYFSLADGSSRVHGDASSCRKYNPDWAVPAYGIEIDNAGTVFVSRRDNTKPVRTLTRQSRWEQWSIRTIQRCSEDSAIYHFDRVSPAIVGKEHTYDEPSSWHVAMRLRYTKRAGGKQKKVVRDYTPLSSLREWAAGTMTILIKVYADGKLTSRLAHMEVGAVLEFSAPEPTLRLQPCIALPEMDSHVQHSVGTDTGAGAGAVALEQPWSVGMVAGGTGIAPIWQLLVAMSRHPGAFGGPGCSARLVYSNRRREDILLRSELDGLVQDGQSKPGKLDFKALHTLTGEGQHAAGWDETTGRISEAMLLSTLPEPSPRTVVVICGPSGMNESALRILRGSGYAGHMLVELEA